MAYMFQENVMKKKRINIFLRIIQNSLVTVGVNQFSFVCVGGGVWGVFVVSLSLIVSNKHESH